MTRVLPWTPEEIETLKTMLEQGATGSEIGRAVKRSRNAVLGFIHRNIRKDFVRKSAPRKPRKPKEPKPKPVKVEPKTILKRWVGEGPRSVVPFKLSTGPQPTLLDISRFQCRWITGNGINPAVCGEPTHKETSWCADHHALVFVKRTEKKDDDRRARGLNDRTRQDRAFPR